MRTVILQHHLFKNAGTSVDVALRRSFGAGWRSAEGSGRELTAVDVAALLAAEPEVKALSSHTFRPPFVVPGVLRLLPIVLLRHPLDRVRSAYEFERIQVAETFGAQLAKQHDFAGYVAARLARTRDRAIRNFQTNKLGQMAGFPPLDDAEELLSALECITSLPFVGLVETYDYSMQVFSRVLSREFGPVSLEVVRANTTRAADDGMEPRVAAAEAALGPALAAAFRAANRHDYQLFELLRWMHARMQES
jgi:hypothetical protein